MANRQDTIGFIGLGTMGSRMAANLQKTGYRLVLNDLRQA
jgi:3-hydroxyisobutyrate dehydrogenase-like beta-hydroxyacid dehydrogenase